MRILISGYFGFRNLGDELILHKEIEDVKEIVPDAEIIVWSGNPSYTEEFHGVKAVNRFSVDDTVDAVKESDVVIVGGGGLIHEYFGINVKDMFNSFGYNIPAYFIVPLIAKMFKKPLFYWCHGVGPIFSEDGKKLLSWFYSLSDFTTVRDRYSFNLLSSVSGLKPLVDIDPVLAMDITKFLEKNWDFRDNSLIVGLNLRPWFGIDLLIDRLLPIVSEISRKYTNIIFVPIPFDLSDSGDKVVLRKFFEKFDEEGVRILDNITSEKDVISLLSSVDLFIGMRYHSLILSFLLKKRSFAISYDSKTDELIRNLGIEGEDYLSFLENNDRKSIKDFILNNANKEKVTSSIDFSFKKEYITPVKFRHFLKGLRGESEKG